MGDFEKNKNLMNGKGEDDVQWITVKGNHIPIKDGENPQESIKNHFANKNKVNETNNEKSEQIQKLVRTLKQIKKIKLKELVDYVKGLKPIKLQVKDDEILAEFDSFTAKKNIYSRSNSDYEGQKFKIENIKNLSNYIQTSSYLKSTLEKGKDSPQHKGVKMWHYFKNKIQTDKGVFDITINIRDKGMHQYIYEVAFKLIKKPENT